MVTVDIKTTTRTYLLRNGQEMPQSIYKAIRKEYDNSITDQQIWEIYQQRQTRQDDGGILGESSNQEGIGGEKDSFGIPTQSVSIELEKAKYILEHQNIFSKTDVARAKKAFKID